MGIGSSTSSSRISTRWSARRDNEETPRPSLQSSRGELRRRPSTSSASKMADGFDERRSRLFTSISLPTHPTLPISPLPTRPTLPISPLPTHPTPPISPLPTHPTLPISSLPTHPTIPASPHPTHPTTPASPPPTHPTLIVSLLPQ